MHTKFDQVYIEKYQYLWYQISNIMLFIEYILILWVCLIQLRAVKKLM